MQIFLNSLSLNGWGKSPFNALLRFCLSLAAEEKAKLDFLWSQSPLNTKETLSVLFAKSMVKTAMDGRPLCRAFQASERAGSGNFSFFWGRNGSSRGFRITFGEFALRSCCTKSLDD